MNKEQAIEKLSKIKKNNENYLATHGTEIVDIDKIVIEDNQALDLAITALENSIQFKPFEFPSWEELIKPIKNVKHGKYLLLNRTVGHYEFYLSSDVCGKRKLTLKTVNRLWKYENSEKSYIFSKEAYERFKNTINDRKLELCKQLAK